MQSPPCSRWYNDEAVGFLGYGAAREVRRRHGINMLERYISYTGRYQSIIAPQTESKFKCIPEEITISCANRVGGMNSFPLPLSQQDLIHTTMISE